MKGKALVTPWRDATWCRHCAQVHDGSYTPTDQFLKDPDSLCSTISWRDEEDRVIWVYKIQVG